MYALCMGFYFSQDAKWLRFRIEGVSVGKGFQRLGHAIAVGYTFLLFWYLFVALGWALVPPDLGLTYGLFSNFALLYIVSLMIDILDGRWVGPII